ncbi:unnamed protein product [Trichogramma brassicae]|uniref:Uncharacterized protein n=1 Tax=Trichogramma brassicae TaxID=86971 RepID=A0A6H5I5I2_9HYME|nr:unnamed protein product [Trichogramma brassicae]
MADVRGQSSERYPDRLADACWRHVPTKDNPSDCATRGRSPLDWPHFRFGGMALLGSPTRSPRGRFVIGAGGHRAGGSERSVSNHIAGALLDREETGRAGAHGGYAAWRSAVDARSSWSHVLDFARPSYRSRCVPELRALRSFPSWAAIGATDGSVLPAVRVTTRTTFFKPQDWIMPDHCLSCFPGDARPIYQGYIAIFICMVVRAVHVEVVSDLTTGAFSRLRRFLASAPDEEDLRCSTRTMRRPSREQRGAS